MNSLRQVSESVETINSGLEALQNNRSARYIPKHRFDEVNEAWKAAKLEITKLQQQVNVYKPFAARCAALYEELHQLKQAWEHTNQQLRMRIEELEREHEVNAHLLEICSSPKYIKLVKALLNMQQVRISEDEIIGLGDQIVQLRQTAAYAFLFTKD